MLHTNANLPSPSDTILLPQNRTPFASTASELHPDNGSGNWTALWEWQRLVNKYLLSQLEHRVHFGMCWRAVDGGWAECRVIKFFPSVTLERNCTVYGICKFTPSNQPSEVTICLILGEQIIVHNFGISMIHARLACSKNASNQIPLPQLLLCSSSSLTNFAKFYNTLALTFYVLIR